ncbi:MAG: FAD-dependent thymidylate synthase [Nanoarchaeota archaeon]
MSNKIVNGYTIPCLDHGFVRYIDHFGSDQRIVETARISYKSPSKGEEHDKKLLHYLYKNFHTSPMESCNITFNIKFPIFCMRQFVRHRTFRLNEWSGRYSELADEFYIPKNWRKQDAKNKQGSLQTQDFDQQGGIIPYKDGQPDKNGNLGVLLTGTLNETFTNSVEDACKKCYSIYEMLLSSGVAKEMARIVLPVNLYTEIYVNCDVHNLMHFFRLRLDPHAQWEIREYAKAMFEIFEKLYPWCAEAYKKYTWVLKENEI